MDKCLKGENPVIHVADAECRTNLRQDEKHHLRWIIEVLADLDAFAKQNGLNNLEGVLRLAEEALHKDALAVSRTTSQKVTLANRPPRGLEH